MQPDWTELQSDTPSTRNCQLCWAPNISGRTGIGWSSGLGATTDIGQTGAFQVTEGVDRTASSGGIGNWNYHLDFDASESDSIFGMGSTVQPNALLFLPCIKT